MIYKILQLCIGVHKGTTLRSFADVLLVLKMMRCLDSLAASKELQALKQVD